MSGLWIGGTVPLGYRAENRRLVIDEEAARTVRHLFDCYLELKSVGIEPKSGKRGEPRGKPFGCGNLYHLHSNPIYIGKVRHRNSLHEGEHEPVVDGGAFERAQALLAEQAPRRASPKNNLDVHFLTGILFDEMCDRLSPTHAKKGTASCGRDRRWGVRDPKSYLWLSCRLTSSKSTGGSPAPSAPPRGAWGVLTWVHTNLHERPPLKILHKIFSDVVAQLELDFADAEPRQRQVQKYHRIWGQAPPIQTTCAPTER